MSLLRKSTLHSLNSTSVTFKLIFFVTCNVPAQVSVHNGWKFVSEPHIVFLEPEYEGGKSVRKSPSPQSSLRGRGSCLPSVLCTMCQTHQQQMSLGANALRLMEQGSVIRLKVGIHGNPTSSCHQRYHHTDTVKLRNTYHPDTNQKREG